MSVNDKKNDEFADNFLEQTEKKINLAFKPLMVMPGDDVTANVSSGIKTIKIGTGLRHADGKVSVTTPGTLHYRAPANYWVETDHKRYFPKTDDQIVGIIDQVAGDFYTVNIFSGSNCILNRQAFEGATKRNKPELKRGDVLYARVTKSSRDCDVELSCISTTGSKKEWSTGETVYGELPQGLLVKMSVGRARDLLKPDNVVLNALGQHFAFEAAVGMNGAVWIRTKTCIDSVIIRNAILNSEFLSDVETEAMVEQLIKVARKIKK